MSPKKRARSLWEAASRLCLICALGFQAHAAAQGHSFSPAGLGDDDPFGRMEVSPRDLTRRKTEIEIRCQTFVEADGNLSDYYCIPPNIGEDQKITQKVLRTLEELRFVPARVDGEPIRVLMNFRVSIECAAKACAARSAPNDGSFVDELGADYSAPQPIVPRESWYVGHEDKLEWLRAYMPNLSFRFNQSYWPMRLTMRAEVDADGTASRGCIYSMVRIGDDTQQRNRQKLERALAGLGEARFVPAFRDGRAVRTQFVEHGVFKNEAQFTPEPLHGSLFLSFANRYYARALALPDEAPELYCID